MDQDGSDDAFNHGNTPKYGWINISFGPKTITEVKQKDNEDSIASRPFLVE